MKKYFKLLFAFGIVSLFYSCGVYNRNVMFQTDHEIIADPVLDALSRTEKNYIVSKNDYLGLTVFTNNGEKLVDPTGELSIKGLTGKEDGGVKFLVYTDGTAKLPLVGTVYLEGLRLRQVDSLLEKKYSVYYNDVFVKTELLNKRVIVLGAGNANMNGYSAGARLSGQVVPLVNENMNLIEVLAMIGGVDQDAKIKNIRIIRGDLKNPNIYLIDLSTIEGVKAANLMVQPNDIIYIERYNKVVSQVIREISPIIGFVGTVVNFLVLIALLNKQ